jgi:hypothetical protein
MQSYLDVHRQTHPEPDFNNPDEVLADAIAFLSYLLAEHTEQVGKLEELIDELIPMSEAEMRRQFGRCDLLRSAIENHERISAQVVMLQTQLGMTLRDQAVRRAERTQSGPIN